MQAYSSSPSMNQDVTGSGLNPAMIQLLVLYHHASLATRRLQLTCDEMEETCPELAPTFDSLADEFHRVRTELEKLEGRLERAVEAMGQRDIRRETCRQ